MPYLRNKSNYKLPVVATEQGELNIKLLGKLKRCVRAGNFLDVAARANGVSPNLFYKWLQAGEKEIIEYKKFKMRGIKAVSWDKLSMQARLFYEVDKAMAEFETNCVLTLNKHGEKNYKAILSILERRFRDRWADISKLQVEQTGEVVHIVKVPKESRTIEEWEMEEEAIAKANKQNGKELVEASV